MDEALRIAEQMAEGLAHAHSRGVLHRDLEPANVSVCEDGRVKLFDFGLTHLLGTDGSSGAGTPAASGAAEGDRTESMWEAPKAPAPATMGEPKLGGVPRPVARVMGAALS